VYEEQPMQLPLDEYREFAVNGLVFVPPRQTALFSHLELQTSVSIRSLIGLCVGTTCGR